MGKKKKGGNKLARMSEEERARYLQHRADMEEEARRRKQQLIALYMKNKLKREDAFTRLNLAKINQEWRSILRQMKCDELKNEIKNVESFCAESLERKNQVIRRLLGDLDESEELYSTMLHSHMDNIDRIIHIHTERLKFWRDWYVAEKKGMLDRFYKHIEGYKIRKNNAQADLECIYYALEDEIRSDEVKAENEYLKRADNFRNAMTIRLEEVTKVREAKMEEMWCEFQIVLSNYLTYTKEFHDDYLDLKRHDEDDTKIIQSHYCEVARCSDLIVDLRLEYNALRDDYQFSTSQLKIFKMDLQQRYNQVKLILTSGVTSDKRNIRNLVVFSNEALKFLNQILKKGNVLFQLSTICRKLETENEKFLAFNINEKKFHLDEEDTQIPPFDFKTNTYKNFSKMEHFWARYNRSRLDCACLQEEKQHLLADNKRLKIKIKEYLVDVTMKTGSTGNSEAKLGNRPKSMTVEKMVRIDLTNKRSSISNVDRLKQRPVTCIEGNLSVAIRSKSITQLKHKPRNMYATVNKI